VQGLHAAAANFDITMVCDLDVERARALAVQAGGDCESFTDYRRALTDQHVDVVDICLPPELHVDVALQALEAGKHVVCEKPLATSLADVDRLIAAAESASRVLAPVFQYRHGAGFRTLLHLIGNGIAGKPLVATLETHWDRGDEYYAVPWRGTWSGEGGGVVLSHVIHAHDLLTTVLGPVRQVLAFTATRVNAIEVDDCAAVGFELCNGTLATSSITLGSANEISRLRFCFENLTAESGLEPYHPGGKGWTFTARAPLSQADLEAALGTVATAPEGFAGYFTELGKRLRRKPAELADVRDARQSIELVTAIYRARANGTAVRIPLTREADYHGWAPLGS